jgi:porin
MIKLLVILAMFPIGFVFAAEDENPSSVEPALASNQAADPAGYQSGYGQIAEFGGPDGVSEQLKEADRSGEPTFEWAAPGRWFKPWYDWKTKIKRDNGVALGVFASVLAQKASDRTTDEDDALGGIYRFQGSWTLLNNGGKNPGRIEWRVENRSNIGSFQAPGTLGSAVGASALNTGFGYSEKFKTDLAVINWTQGFRDSTTGIAVGRLAFDVYLDAFAFQTFSGGFLNRSFLVNPTIGTTGIGALGAVGKGMVTDQLWIGGQIYDGNAASGDWDWDSVQENEYLKALEIGWTPSFARRKLDKIQFTYWDKDERDLAGVSSGHGWAVSASWRVGEKWLPFVRFGDSNGGAGVAAEQALSGGFQYTVRADQKWVLGVGWAKPSEKTNGAKLDDEYVIETSYNFQLAKNFALLPDLQLVVDPANNPDQSKVWVAGLRAILTF